jgi:hypothetical protein
VTLTAHQFLQVATARLSVILCTYNPRPQVLCWAVESIAAQTLPPEQIEFIAVDNNSRPPLDPSLFSAAPARMIREPRQGLTFARIAGIENSRGNILVFLDDDNHLDADYLERALAIADSQPWIGCFGGCARAALDAPLPRWKDRLLPYFGVREYGPLPLTSTIREWGEWEPIGAGMVVRRDVAERWAQWMRAIPGASRLGRNGGALLSGEDSLFAHAAYQLGYACSYQPSLKLSHWIAPRRLRPGAIARTLYGHGRSSALLEKITGARSPRWREARSLVGLARRYRRHLRDVGFPAGALEWCRDAGYFVETRRSL